MFVLLECLTDALQYGWCFLDDEMYSIPAELFADTYLDVVAILGGTVPWSGMFICPSNTSQ